MITSPLHRGSVGCPGKVCVQCSFDPWGALEYKFLCPAGRALGVWMFVFHGSGNINIYILNVDLIYDYDMTRCRQLIYIIFILYYNSGVRATYNYFKTCLKNLSKLV